MSGTDELRLFINDAQRAMANLSIDSKDVILGRRPGGATYLVFEILNLTSTGLAKFFTPYVSEELYLWEDKERITQSAKDALQRLWKNSEELSKEYNLPRPESTWDLESVKKDLRELIRLYKSTEIPVNVAATALIFKAWKNGKFQSIEDKNVVKGLFKENGTSTRALPINKFLEQLAKDLGLGELRLGESLIDGRKWLSALRDKPYHEWIEFSLIHKTLSSNISEFKVIHYPLIINRYWFVGFAYIFKVGKLTYARSPLFNRGEYLRGLSILNDSFAQSLKRGLMDRAVEEINFKEEIEVSEDALLVAAKRYMSCFDFENPNDPKSKCLHFDGFNSYPSLKIKVFVPEWIAQTHKKSEIHKELNALFSEISRRKKEADALREVAFIDIGRGVFHNIGHYTSPISTYADSFYEEVNNNEYEEASTTSLWMKSLVERMTRFVNAVQPHIRLYSGSYGLEYEHLGDVPVETLLIPAEGLSGAIKSFIKSPNSGAPEKYRSILGGLYSCNYTEIEGKEKLHEKLKNAGIGMLPLGEKKLDTLIEWLRILRLHITFEGEFSQLKGPFALIVGVLEELVLNGFEASAKVISNLTEDERAGITPEVVIAALPETANTPASISISNWAVERLDFKPGQRPIGDTGWGLYSMHLIMKKMGGGIEISDDGSTQTECGRFHKIQLKIILPHEKQ